MRRLTEFVAAILRVHELGLRSTLSREIAVSNQVNIFDVSTTTAPDQPLYGAAATSGWLTGSLRTEDGLDFAAEFDAQASARLGADVGRGLAKLQGNATAAAHAGLRLQAGLPLDLFEAAGIMARLRLEASASAQARVTASMSLAELNDLVLDRLPTELRPYVKLIIEEAKIEATVWAKASFAAMAVAEVTAVANLFPRDGRPAGISAVFNYGFAWGYGGAWGATANFGFNTAQLLRRLTDQAGADLGAALTAYRRSAGIGDDNPLAALIDASEVVLPATLNSLVTWCMSQRDADADSQQASLGDVLLVTLRKVLSDSLLPRLLHAALNAIDVDLIDDEQAVRNVWASVVRTVTALRAGPGSGSALEPVGAVAALIADVGDLLNTPETALVRRAVTCAAALAALVADETAADTPSLRALLGAAAGTPVKSAAVQVLLEQLGDVLADEGVLPAWAANLFGDLVQVTTLLAGSSTMTKQQAATALSSLLSDIETAFTDAGLWDHLNTVVAPELVRAVRAQVKILIDVCATLAAAEKPDAHRIREAVSVGILILIGRPISEMSKAICGRAFEAVPPALRELADTVDTNDDTLNLDASWGELARQVVGTTVGFPAAQLMRHVAHTTEQWMTTMLPGELALLDNYLLVDNLADRILEIGPRPAIAEFKQTLLPIVARHVVDHVVNSLEFVLLDSINLFETMVTGLATNALRTLEISAIVAFRLTEEAVLTAEKAVNDLVALEQQLQKKAEKAVADFFAQVAAVANRIRNIDAWIGQEVTNWLIRQCLGPAGVTVPPPWNAALNGLVTGAVLLVSGGAIGATQAAARGLADTLQASADSLRIMAETEEGSAVGMEALVRSLFRGDNVPGVEVPIGISFPNPIFPWIWHYIEFTRVKIPANIISGLVMTLLLDGVGAGPVIRALNDTARALRDTKTALATVRRAVNPGTAQRMRTALEDAKPDPGTQLRVEIVNPQPGAVLPPQGTITVRLYGANYTYVDPQDSWLPAQAEQRVRMYLNGQQVPLREAQWADWGTYIQGEFPYSEHGSLASTGLRVRAGAASLTVLLVGGFEGGPAPAQASCQFVIEPAPALTVNMEITEIQWFPIAIANPFIRMRHPGVQLLPGTTVTVQEFPAEPLVVRDRAVVTVLQDQTIVTVPQRFSRATTVPQLISAGQAAQAVPAVQVPELPILVAHQANTLTRIADHNPNGVDHV